MERQTGPAAAEPLVLATRNETAGPDAGPALGWARRIARSTGARLVSAPEGAPGGAVLDLAAKREVRWVVSGLGWKDPPDGRKAALDGDLDVLLRRAPCPVLSVQPWSPPPDSSPGVAVVGVDRSTEARAVAHAAAELLATGRSPARLILVHGCADHPSELAAKTSWRELAGAMRPERHDWILTLASELRTPQRIAEVVVRLSWAPDLIAGTARCVDADFTALGVAARGEGEEVAPSPLQQRVLRGTPCPMLTLAASRGG